MAKKLNIAEIKKYWTRQALEYAQSSSASWSDRMAIELEIKEIIKYLAAGDNVLDIGCGNGYSTMQFAVSRQIKIKGVDYVSEMIKQARLRVKKLPVKFRKTIDFDIKDMTALKEQSETYDKVIVIRTVINLGTWNCQLKGLKECARVLKSGGMLLLSEATLQGWRKLNKTRREFGLPNITMPFFNLYLDQEKIIKALSPYLQLVNIVNFSSTYYIGTRLLKPLSVKLGVTKVDTTDPDTEWNRWFAQLPSFGDYGIQKLFIFRKL